jgi:hypothetical protein
MEAVMSVGDITPKSLPESRPGHSIQRIAREPIEKVTLAPIKRIKRTDDKPPRKLDSCFAMVPKSVLWPPPIAHRHTHENKHFVSPFQFAVLGALLIEAARAWAGQRHQLAFAHGGTKQKLEKQYEKKYRAELATMTTRREAGATPMQAPRPRRQYSFTSEQSYKPMAGAKALKQAGQKAYQARREALRQGPPPAWVTLTLTRSKLLKLAGLPKKGTNLAKLDQALDRLRKPVGDQVGPLHSWQETAGALRLNVLGDWLLPPFVKVPLPVPTSPSALALFLFIQKVDTHSARRNTRGERGAMRRKKLCDLLGIPTSRAFQAAFRAVSRHLKGLPTLRLQKALKLKEGDFPNRIACDGLPNDRIRIRTWKQHNVDQ